MSGLEQGRVYSGREALSYKLIDQIGGEAEVVQWLEQQRNVPKGLKIVDWKPERESDWGLGRLSTEGLAHIVGDSAAGFLVRIFGNGQALARLQLDGLVSLWQGSEK